MKNILKIFTILILLLISVIFSLLYFVRKNNPANYSLYSITNSITEQRYQDGKAFEVILRESVSDEEGIKIAEEFLNYKGVNGNTLYTRELQKNSDYSFLYPKDVTTIQQGSRVVIDLFVENTKDKKSIIEQVKLNPNVEVVLELIPQ